MGCGTLGEQWCLDEWSMDCVVGNEWVSGEYVVWLDIRLLVLLRALDHLVRLHGFDHRYQRYHHHREHLGHFVCRDDDFLWYPCR